MPVLVGIAIVICSLVFWQALAANERNRIDETTVAEAGMISRIVASEVDEHFQTLRRMADRWAYSERPEQRTWQQHAELNMNDFPGFRTIQWMDTSYRVQWVVPTDMAPDRLRFDHTVVPERREALIHARQSGRATASIPVDLAQGDRGFVVYQPVFMQTNVNRAIDESSVDNFDGFIIGTFSTQELFDAVLFEVRNEGYGVAILSDGEEIHHLSSDGRLHEADRSATDSFELAGRDWSVRVWPESSGLSRQQSSLPVMALIGGMVLAGLMVALVRLFQVARARTAEAQAYSAVLTASAQALEASNRDLEKFAYVASHDLKAPLVSLRGMANILTEDYGHSLPSEGQLYLERISVNASKMQNLLDDVLQMSRLRQAEVPLVDIDLNMVVQSVTDQLSQMLVASGATVSVPGSLPVVRGNAMWLNQIFSNLIDNGVKYASTDKPAAIQITYHEREYAWEVHVRDNGPGIPQQYCDKVFGMFQRLPNGKAINPGGSGMGLAIVARGVEAHGGKVWIESTGPAGTTFAFTIARDGSGDRIERNGRRPVEAGIRV